jgi:hypothetical protein
MGKRVYCSSGSIPPLQPPVPLTQLMPHIAHHLFVNAFVCAQVPVHAMGACDRNKPWPDGNPNKIEVMQRYGLCAFTACIDNNNNNARVKPGQQD